MARGELLRGGCGYNTIYNNPFKYTFTIKRNDNDNRISHVREYNITYCVSRRQYSNSHVPYMQKTNKSDYLLIVRSVSFMNK